MAAISPGSRPRQDTEEKVEDAKTGGQITLFTKSDCPYCVKLKETVERCAKRVLAKHPEGRLDWKFVDCQGAHAAQCVRLTGSFSVPHVFFNDEYIGDCTATCSQSTQPSEEENPIIHKLTKIALGPKMVKTFPPAPDATIVKITDDLACSGQPSDDQLGKLKSSFGFASVVNLTSPVEASFSSIEESVLKQSGLEYKSMPILSMNASMIRNIMNQVSSCPKPALVHCDTGQRAAVIALLLATKGEPCLKDEDFVAWGRDLGMDLSPFVSVAISIARDATSSSCCDGAVDTKRFKKIEGDDDECSHCSL